MSMAYLLLAVILEVLGTTCMKLADGFTRPGPSAGIVIFYGASLACLTMALKKFDVSFAYAFWSGLGTALIATIGIVYFHEEATLVKFASLALIIIGVVGLNLSTEMH